MVGLPSARPKRSLRRALLLAFGLLLVVAALFFTKYAQIATVMAAGKRAQAAGPPPEAVNTSVAKKEVWEQSLSSIGSVAAARGVSISNDAAGIVQRIEFESGRVARAGQVLVELDARVERAQLASARAKQRLASEQATRTRTLARTGAATGAQLDVDESALSAADADVNAIAAQIARKTVRAPFAGKLGIRLVNLGQYLSAGTPITVLESAASTFVDFSLPQQHLASVRVGMPVLLTLGSAGAEQPLRVSTGAIDALDPRVDPATRNIKLRATVGPDADWLRPGMFVNVAVVLPETDDVVSIPRTAVVHASSGDSVFIVQSPPAGIDYIESQSQLGLSTIPVRLRLNFLGRPVDVVEGLLP